MRVLRAVKLRVAFESPNSVVEVGRLRQRNFILRGGTLQQGQTPPLKLRFADRVLRDHPRGIGPVFGNERAAGPPVLLDDLGETGGVAAMYFFHARMVAVEQRPISGKLLAHGLIRFAHSQEFQPQ